MHYMHTHMHKGSSAWDWVDRRRYHAFRRIGALRIVVAMEQRRQLLPKACLCVWVQVVVVVAADNILITRADRPQHRCDRCGNGLWAGLRRDLSCGATNAA